ncbi:MAG: choice-of-anchor J domain-containing protein [Bacteroidales bacterium]|nr:choice-of-anchor J domain-containing protein [Bacteroidales bacterium]
MKKLVYILLMFIITFSACDPNEEIYDELDGLKEPYEAPLVNVAFTADDYATASKYAKMDAVSVGDADSSIAKLIGSMEAFNLTYTAEDYVGKVVGDMFPEYGKNSKAMVTYKYVDAIPEDLAIYADAESYVLGAADYESVSFEVGVANYFHPEFPADYYLPEILENSVTGASEDDIYKISYKYSEENPVIATSTIFTESFDDGLGQFDTTNVLGEKGWYTSSYGDSYYMSMSGFQQNTEDWLISNPIELDNSGSISFNFTHEIKYLNHQWNQLSVAISSDYDGSDISGATWDVIDWGDVADTASLGSGYDPFNSGDIDISGYANETIYIAFKYTSTTDNAPTWHILDVTVDPIKEMNTVAYGKTPYAKNDLYEFDGSKWTKLDDVYCLNSNDYDAMGVGGDDMFSADNSPQDYLPNFLTAKYPGAGQGVTKTIIYQYDSDVEGEVTLATKYSYTDQAWESAYDYIQEATNQFINNGTEWLFDPTVTVTMGTSNYQFIVDYVEGKYGTELINSYGTADFVYGVDAYYKEFDLNDFDPSHEEFSDIEDPTWEDGAEKAIGTLLLPDLFPDATTLVNGVDMYYRVIFLTYDYGKEVYYSMTFSVSKEGPDPEFELVETTEL